MFFEEANILIREIHGMQMPSFALADHLAELFVGLPQVVAVALGGSLGRGDADAASDIDLYVYTRTDIPLADRRSVVERSGGASRADLGLTYWGPGDEWFHAVTGTEVDVVYFDADWMENQIAGLIRDHRPSLGYTTCFWHTVRHSRVLADFQGWFTALQNTCSQEYPELLRRNIITLNHPVLRSVIPSYVNQIEKAVRRQDWISVNHRLAAFFASYFDVLFAINRQLHPGEKRLLQLAQRLCDHTPVDMETDATAVLRLAAAGDKGLLGSLALLLDHLDQLLEAQGFALPINSSTEKA
jgi:predicted nucleotidyltransferase